MNKRSYRKRKTRRNRKIKRFRIYASIALIISLTILAFKFVEGNKNGNESTDMVNMSKEEVENAEYLLIPGKENKALGEIESIIEYGDNGLIGAHYPVLGKSIIDAKNKEIVNKYIGEFKKELTSNRSEDKDYKYELSIDYEIYSGPNDRLSLVFNIVKNSSYLANPDEEIVTKVYDLSKDKEVRLDDLMEGEYLNFISKKSEDYFKMDEQYKENIDSPQFKEAIYPSIENYSSFILKEDKIIFVFPKYTLFSGNLGRTFVDISYPDLKNYLKPDIAKEFLKENHSEKIEINSDKKDIDILIPKRVIDPEKPMIALTFDDGPNEKVTLPILDTLKEYDSAGTFFILGNRVPSNESILKRMLEEGSEIGNHSYNHKELTKVSSEELKKQIGNTQDAVIDSTDIRPKLMRPTYGSFNDNLKAQVAMPLILWSIDTLDWKTRSAKMVTDHVLENIKDGDIVLMHDIYDSTAEAVEVLVPKLKDMGYQLVTVSELYEASGESLDKGQVYNGIHKK